VIVCDTAPLVAAALFRDPDHRRCVDLFAGPRMANRDMLLPAPIIAEVGYLLAAKAGRPYRSNVSAVGSRGRLHLGGPYEYRLRTDG
jgi:predicted nucleic acid-binding protein